MATNLAQCGQGLQLAKAEVRSAASVPAVRMLPVHRAGSASSEMGCRWLQRLHCADPATAAGEVHRRMRAAGVAARTVTLKLKRRKEGAPEPPKFLGHGSCDNMSR